MYYVKVINTYSKDVYVKECKKNQVSDRIVGDFWETSGRLMTEIIILDVLLC